MQMLMPFLKLFNFMKRHWLVLGTVICAVSCLRILRALHGTDDLPLLLLRHGFSTLIAAKW